MAAEQQENQTAAPPKGQAVLYVCAERGLHRTHLAAERAEEEGQEFAGKSGLTIAETIKDPYSEPDPAARKGWRRVRELAESAEIDTVIVRWPTTIAPDHSHELRHREINELQERGVQVLYSWPPLTPGCGRQ
jgi:hypothetical protein